MPDVQIKRGNPEPPKKVVGDTPKERNEIKFTVLDENKNQVDMIIISKDGFYYKGEKVDDAHDVYNRFHDWLAKAEITQ